MAADPDGASSARLSETDALLRRLAGEADYSMPALLGVHRRLTRHIASGGPVTGATLERANRLMEAVFVGVTQRELAMPFGTASRLMQAVNVAGDTTAAVTLATSMLDTYAALPEEQREAWIWRRIDELERTAA
jgi:hypothetical protein